MRGLISLPSQILTLGDHGSAEKDVEEDIVDIVGYDEEAVAESVAESVAEDVTDLKKWKRWKRGNDMTR